MLMIKIVNKCKKNDFSLCMKQFVWVSKCYGKTTIHSHNRR